jgi:hypothetical protein
MSKRPFSVLQSPFSTPVPRCSPRFHPIVISLKPTHPQHGSPQWPFPTGDTPNYDLPFTPNPSPGLHSRYSFPKRAPLTPNTIAVTPIATEASPNVQQLTQAMDQTPSAQVVHSHDYAMQWMGDHHSPVALDSATPAAPSATNNLGSLGQPTPIAPSDQGLLDYDFTAGFDLSEYSTATHGPVVQSSPLLPIIDCDYMAGFDVSTLSVPAASQEQSSAPSAFDSVFLPQVASPQSPSRNLANATALTVAPSGLHLNAVPTPTLLSPSCPSDYATTLEFQSPLTMDLGSTDPALDVCFDYPAGLDLPEQLQTPQVEATTPQVSSAACALRTMVFSGMHPMLPWLGCHRSPPRLFRPDQVCIRAFQLPEVFDQCV